MIRSLNLFENIKSVGDALKFMGFPTVPTPVDLKATYRKLAMTMHPDQGGTDEQMKDLTAAYTLLSKATPGGGPSASSYADNLAQMKEKNGRMYDLMLVLFASAFDERAFSSYLTKFISEPLTVKLSKSSREDTVNSPYCAFGASITASNADKTLSVHVYYHVTPTRQSSTGLGGGDIDERDAMFDVSTSTEIYFAKRKQKIGQRDWQWGRKASSTEDFTEILPPVKMKKIFSGGTSKIFKRADMKLGLEKEAGADYQSSGTREDFRFDICGYDTVRQKKGMSYIVLNRSVFDRMPRYGFSFIGTFNNLGKLISQNIYYQSNAYIEETEENLDKIVALIKHIRKLTEAYDERADGPKIFSVVKQEISKAFPM